MNTFRITKYDPLYRDAEGKYTKEEWTSISDIGKVFDDRQFTRKEYEKVEGSYLNCLLDILAKERIDKLSIGELENYSNSLNSICESGFAVGAEQIRDVVVANLRETIWCKLQSADFFIHFGFDYYMYLGTRLRPQTVNSIALKYGLFAEEYASPYLPEV